MTPADRPGDTGSLFDDLPVPPDPTGHGSVLVLGEQAVVLRGLALPMAGQLKDAIDQWAAQQGLVTAAHAQVKLDEKDPQAVALGYVADSSKADKKKYPKHTADQNCHNCTLFQGKATDAAGGCALFAGKQVAGKGWCSAWVKKA